MIHLFEDNKREDWNDLSRAYDREICEAIRPIFKRAQEKGHSIRDLMLIAKFSVDDIALPILVGWEDKEEE